MEYTVHLAKADRLELVIVAVLTPTYKADKLATWGIALTPGVEEEVRQLVQRVLDQAFALAKAFGIQYICKLREGRAPDEILKTAAEYGCDLIIISRGLSGVSRVTLGETGDEVVAKAWGPVLVMQ